MATADLEHEQVPQRRPKDKEGTKGAFVATAGLEHEQVPPNAGPRNGPEMGAPSELTAFLTSTR